jgi:lipoprotein-anchoring transpeptidase ErfK/SrfK
VSQSYMNDSQDITAGMGPRVAPDYRESIPLTEASDRLLMQGVEAARAGRCDEALRLIDQALAVYEGNVEALLWRGGLSAPDESLPYLEKAAALDPGNERVRRGLEWARGRVGLAPLPPVAAISTFSVAPPPPPARRPAARPATRHSTVRTSYSPTISLPHLPTPDVTAAANDVLNALVAQPLIALIIAIMLVGLLGTVAVAKAEMSRNLASNNAAATPQSTSGGHKAPVVTAGSAITVSAHSLTSTQPASAMTLDEAWAASDWPQVITLVQSALARTPGDADLVQKLFTAHYNYGVQLVRNDRLKEALNEFDSALAINASDVNAQGERQFAKLYLDGITALQENDPGTAVKPLRTIYDGNPNYREVKDKLYQAYIGWADTLEIQGNRSDAYVYYQKAALVDSTGQEAQAGMARLKDAEPASALAKESGKKIEVDLAKQQVTVWDGDKVVYRFAASTGKAPYVTRTGNFEILSKLPNAYSRALDWGMPNWMGIYQAGGTENGFHGMARLSGGQVMSTSVLGHPATTGCIMLSDSNSKTLYDWADIGTPVWIH